MTREQAIAARLEAASPGDWWLRAAFPGDDYEQLPDWDVCSTNDVVTSLGPDGYQPADADLIANTPSDLAHLLSRLSEVEGERDAAVALLRAISDAEKEHGDCFGETFDAVVEARALLDSFKGSSPGAGEDS